MIRYEDDNNDDDAVNDEHNFLHSVIQQVTFQLPQLIGELLFFYVNYTRNHKVSCFLCFQLSHYTKDERVRINLEKR